MSYELMKRTTAIAIAVALVTASLAAPWTTGARPAQAALSQYISVDVTTTGNERNAVGVIDSCTSVQAGEDFTVDVVIRDVADVVAWEFRFEFDHEKVALNSVDYDHFLLSYDDGITISPKLMDVENSNRVFIGAGEARGAPDSGSGVLARLSMQALDEGLSPLKITSAPVFRGPRVTNSSGDPVGDADGDGLWDSGISNAQVAVDSSCDDVEPIPTPPPVSPGPGGGSNGGGTGNGGGSGTTSGGGAVAVIDDAGSDEDGDDPGSESGDGDESDGSGGQDGSEDGSGGDEAGDGPDAAGSEDSEQDGDSGSNAGDSPGGNDDDGFGVIPIIGIVGLVLAAVGAGTLYVFRSRGQI